ncbi:TPA: RING finger protein 32 [Trebouxia sp. C0004]
MPRMPEVRNRRQSKLTSDAKILLNAVALQDHFARMLQIPGAKLKPASLKPGASPTLAQRHGLVKAPPPLLSEQQWLSMHAKSTSRQDSQHECSICCEHFGMEEQVLLSCSHVFHKQCITSFERFARSRCCPLCRTEAYQKRQVHDGKAAHRHRCAAQIQAAVRGFLARKWYRHLRRHLPPSNPCLTRKWAAEQLQDNTGRLLKEMAAAQDNLDSLFAELDVSLAQSRQVFSQVAVNNSTAHVLAQRDSNAVMLATSSFAVDGQIAAEEATSELQVPAYVHVGDPLVADEPESAAQLYNHGIQWDAVIALALERGSTECAICLGALDRHGSQGVAWLSCTHVYHVDCISLFEAFEMSRGSQPSCPCCRAKYSWKTL